MLIGKTLEQSRIEVIEEDERFLYKKHRENFKKLKEADLFYSQQVEAKSKSE